MWAVCVKKHDGRVEVVTREMADTFVREDYQQDIHIVPCTPEGSFGVHEFERGCACHPKVENREGFIYVIHSARTN